MSTDADQWITRWDASECFATPSSPGKNKFYNFDSAPFPSGALHIGHARNYVLGDIIARYKRATGHDVLYTTNFDAFGLPNELAAEKEQITPGELTRRNIRNMKRQLKALGISYDWHRVKCTSDPQYYRWTQWLFLKLYEAGYVYKRDSDEPWCAQCNTHLAQMQVRDNCCWRCGTAVENRASPQWFIRITDLNEELLITTEKLEQWSDRAIKLLRGHIGQSTGTLVPCRVHNESCATTSHLDVFLPEGASIESMTFVACAANHPDVMQILSSNTEKNGLLSPDEYAALSGALNNPSKPERLRRTRHGSSGYLRDGIDTGIRVAAPDSGIDIPVWVVNYMSNNRGPAILAGCPAFDAGDHEFARRNGLVTSSWDKHTTHEATKGEKTAYYHVHDWNVSRNRGWGTPIPVMNCNACGLVPVPYENLPFNPQSPEIACPICNGVAAPENFTLDCYLDDCWCFISGPSRNLGLNPFDDPEVREWLPADNYHAGFDIYTYLHIYRFISHFLWHENILPWPEVIKRHSGHDMVLGQQGKISKSQGSANSIEDLLERFNPDAIRLAVSSVSPGKTIRWSENRLQAAEKLLTRFQSMADTLQELTAGTYTPAVYTGSSATMLTVANFIDEYRPQAAIAHLEKQLHELRIRLNMHTHSTSKNNNAILEIYSEYQQLVMLFSVFAPFTCESIWQQMGHETMISATLWETSPDQLKNSANTTARD